MPIPAKLVKVLVDEAAPAMSGALQRAMKTVNPGSYKQLVKEQPFVEEFARKSFQEKDSAMRAANSRAGVRTPGDTEKFMTSDGQVLRTNPTTRTSPDGTAKYTEYNQTLKDERNSKVDEVRGKLIEETTEGAETDFYSFREEGTDAHHIAELDRSAPLVRGLNPAEKAFVFTYLRNKGGIILGHRHFNRADLPKKVHQMFHSWFDQKYGRKSYAGVENLTLKERMKYLDQFIEEYQSAMEKLYELQSKH